MACEPWPVDPTCLPHEWPADPALWDSHQKQAVAVATEVLNRFTAGQFGLCARKIRPCRRRCAERFRADYYGVAAIGGGPYRPLLIDGRIHTIGCGCQGECGCSPVCEVDLGAAVHDVTAVRVDGSLLPPPAYQVWDRRKLVRVDGGCWPDCQELVRPDTAPGTFSVAYRTGNPVPPGGRTAVADLAVNLWKACRGNTKGCALPERVTQVVREGVSYTLLDNLDVFERGRTGLNRVDLWLASVNPYNARAPMRAWSPDTIRARRITESMDVTDRPEPQQPETGYYHHLQDDAAVSIPIAHNLGYRPAGVELFSTDWSTRYTGPVGVTHTDDNNVVITTEEPFLGNVVLG